MILNYYLRPSESDLKPVYLFVSLDGKRKQLKKPVIHIQEKHWNKSEKCVKQNVSGREELQKRLDDFKSRVKKIALDLGYPTLALIQEKIDEEDLMEKEKSIQKEKTVIEIYEEFLRQHETKISPVTEKVMSKGTIKNYRKLKGKLEEFSKDHDLQLKNINAKFEAEFREFLLKQVSVSTYGDYIKILKAFLNWCIDNEIEVNPRYRKIYRPRPKARAKALKETELLSLYSLDLRKDLVLYRDQLIFLFLCSTAMRKSDYDVFRKNPQSYIQSMKVKDTEIQYLDLTAIKNNQEFIVPFFDDLYFRPVWIMNTLLDVFGKMPKIQYEVFHKNLAEIAGMAKIDRIELLSKTGRKTWATLKRKLGTSKHFIKAVTGHRDEKSLDHYIGIDPEDVLNEFYSKAVK